MKILIVTSIMFTVHVYASQEGTSLFGHPIVSRFGIAACPLTINSEDVRKMAERGFGVITYKTIRSGYMPIKSPNVYRVNVYEQLTREQIGSRVRIIDHESTDNDRALTNLYGIGSLSAQETITDLKKAHADIPEGKVLIVSIYGSGNTAQEQIDDFVRTARIAHEGGASIMELNLSCPNLSPAHSYGVTGAEPRQSAVRVGGPLYKDADLVYAVCDAVRHAVPCVNLIIKVSVFDSYEQMRAVMRAAYRAGVRGICGINTVPMCVVNADDEPVYGSDRVTSGLSGEPIRELALEFTRHARAIITEDSMDMVLLATGGVMSKQDYDAFIVAGADVVLCASAALLGIPLSISHQNRDELPY
jgi:dihydroorotate dehydrogenase